MIDLTDIYRYVPFIYQCFRCGQLFPVWMVSDKDWKRGVRAMGCGFGPAKKICKPCYEEFNKSPKYLTVDEYLEMQEARISRAEREWRKTDPQFIFETSPEGIAYKRETVAALWDLPPQYAEEEREEFIAKVGWLRGPFASCREPQPER
jgi:hypothetical protein